MADFDTIVIGAGAAGLSVAAGAAQLGTKVALIERDRMGGDCLNAGCVPSKALLAAGHAAHAARAAARLGVRVGEPEIDWDAVRAHVHGAIAAIASGLSAFSAAIAPSRSPISFSALPRLVSVSA